MWQNEFSQCFQSSVYELGAGLAHMTKWELVED